MNEVVLSAQNSECKLINLAKEFDITFSIISVMPSYYDDICGTLLLEFHASAEAMEKVKDYIVATEKFRLISIEKISPDTHIVLFEEKDSCGCLALAKSGCFLSKCDFSPTGALINIITSKKNSLFTFVNSLSDSGFKITIKRKRGCNLGLDELTDRQREVVRLAYDRGYFDVPKQVSLKELSDEVGVSPSSVDEILKRAEKKILCHYFGR